MCSGKLKTPKWKNFKGIKVGRKDKIRLNNLIWREWHMQCLYHTDFPLCGPSYFSKLKIPTKICSKVYSNLHENYN